MASSKVFSLEHRKEHRLPNLCIHFCIVTLCLNTIICYGQKPINLGGIKRKDVYIAGFFPYGRHVPESHVGRGVMPSVKLAVDHINENPAILRNYRLHMWWNDTECNAAVGVKAFFDMMHSGPHKVMLFGAACTQVTDPIAKASKHWRLTQLSYADTHPMFTSDSFPNFFRVVPSENAFNAPRVALLMQFNWTKVGTIYQNEPRYALAHNRLVADLDDTKLEVIETQSFSLEVTSALEKLKAKDVRIILGNFNEEWARRIFCKVYRLGMFGRKYQWVIMGTYAEEWWLRPGGGCAPSELSEALHGTILTDLLPLATEQQITVSGITPDEYRLEYDSRRGTEYSRFHGYTYDGIWAVALAIQHVTKRIRHFRKNQTVADFQYRDTLLEKLFLEALRNTSFEGVTGPVRFYDNERKACILLKQFQSGSEVKVGEYDGITDNLDLSKGHPLLWRGKSPPKDRTLHIIEHSTVNIKIYAALASAASVGIVMAVVFLAINIKYRNQRYIKMSSPHLNNLIIVGCILTYSSVIFLGLDSQLSSVTAFPYICTARAWLLMAGFSLAFGSMFSKTWRVHSIFTDVKLNKKVITDYQLFMVVGVLLFMDLIIMTTWQVADPFYRETKEMDAYPHPANEDIMIIPENEYCQSNRMSVYLGIIYAYKGLLMIFGAFLAWETRHVSIPALNDSKYVGMSVYNVVIMCITGAAISIVLADKQDAMFIMLAVFIIFCSTATLCLVFVPKIIELRRNPQGAIDRRSRTTLKPMSKTRKDSTISELEDRLKEVTSTNQKFRKQLLDRESELQMYLRRLGDEELTNTQETIISRLHIPKQDIVIKKEGPSVNTETTDISVSMCSLNSTTVLSQTEGDYVNVSSIEQHKKKSMLNNMNNGVSNNMKNGTNSLEKDQLSIEPLNQVFSGEENSKYTAKEKVEINGDLKEQQQITDKNELKFINNNKCCGIVIEDQKRKKKKQQHLKHQQLHVEPSVPSFESVNDNSITSMLINNKIDSCNNGIVESRSLEYKNKSNDGVKRAKIPIPVLSKNVSFNADKELCDKIYSKQKTLFPSSGIVSKHKYTTTDGSLTIPSVSTQQTILNRRRCSAKDNELAQSHHELFDNKKRRTSVPTTNTISYISSENISTKIEDEEETFLNNKPCAHKKTAIVGYRCEKHGGRGYNTSKESSVAIFRKPNDSYNSISSTSVNASYSDTEKYDDSSFIQRSVSERSREKFIKCKHHGGAMSTMIANTARRCRHNESKLSRHVQSTPNVYSKFNNQRGSSRVGNTSVSSCIAGGRARYNNNINESQVLHSALSDGELLDLTILPIFQKLLTQRYKTARNNYGANVASCPNISIKCDIVEYL
ncbi:gamma-aminobutyric acid type B receptor subunit 2 [Leptopilina heterotoma]|uniref:gamma-aminobutyric acid type B receptor subunit 2 n=1 Tax=Leptopilina heterotoma TaxID=63436 RepID=UPI001CA8AD40|nr:gamma-aminobutyric acid type B receptor subunit 2 [Leptopilina heterotoma]